MATKAQKDNAIRTLRQGVSNILNGVGQINDVLATDGITGIVQNLDDSDLTGENEGLTATEVKAAAQAISKILSDLRDVSKNPDIAGQIYAVRL